VWSPPRVTHRGVSCPGAWVMLVFRLRKLTLAANKELIKSYTFTNCKHL
jgi:hypothetical protein